MVEADKGYLRGGLQVTLREYITENMEHFVNSICNLSSCYCCALGNTEDCVLKRCGMSRFALDEELTEEEEKHLCG